MKHGKFSMRAWVFILLCTAVLLAGCPIDPGVAGGGVGFITVTVTTGETKYLSLSTGEAVDAGLKDTPGWDIAFERRASLFRLVFTNGGDTAADLSSGGQCAVYYTEKTNFDDVRQSDAIVFPGYDSDTAKYVAAMGPTERACLNVMSYVGYGSGNGTLISPFSSPFLYNQKQFYTSSEMGVYRQTDRVYIITHADGVTQSKIQINYEYDNATPADVYLVRYEELD
jgi:hypothetical protein